MKAVSGSSWGQQKETLLSTFKALIRPLLDFGAPIIYPNASKTSIEGMQRVQNKCLRVALGCHQMASIQHLHSKAKVLPVADHLNLLSSQFLAKALSPEHVSYTTVTLPDGPRSMKKTLYLVRFTN